MTYAFAAAGTGGHVYPALSVADALVASGVDRKDIVFVGGDRIEAKAVPESGFGFVEVAIQGLKRSLSMQNLRLPSVVWKASRCLTEEFQRRGTRVVIAFGGYIAVPSAWAAQRSGAQLFLQEQNAVPGLANRLISARAITSFIAFPEAANKLRHTRLVGNPLRPAFRSFDRIALRAAGRAHYGLADEGLVLGVLGGSLGARALNEATSRIVETRSSNEFGILHLTGRAHYEAVSARASKCAVPWVTRAFEDRMELFYASSDLVLSRAGALTVSELAATGTPAVVVPFPSETAGHQKANAAYLERFGGAVVVSEREIARIPVEVAQLLGDESRRAAMAQASISQGKPDAAIAIAAALRGAAE